MGLDDDEDLGVRQLLAVLSRDSVRTARHCSTICPSVSLTVRLSDGHEVVVLYLSDEYIVKLFYCLVVALLLL